ncbi:MAG: S8 family serine peptidase, partial [Nitrospiria bacterium]
MGAPLVSVMTPGRRRVAAALWLALSLDGRAYAGAVDPALLPILSGQAPIESFGSPALGILPGSPSVSDPLLSVTLRFTGRISDLRARGLRIGSVMGEIVTAEVSAAELSALTLMPGVISIEAARAVAPLLDVSVKAVGADLIRSRRTDGWNGYTGRGVLVGLIDTGLDLTHADFRKPDGATRVVALWDQSTGVGRPPLGFSYGTECRANQIDVRECPEIDRDGHGTHVAGIAAGNGRATGGEKPAYRYVGIAPEADLVIVKLASLNANRVIDALAYLDRKAAEAGRPVVANISMGASLGAHDGTSAFERAFDAFTTGPPGTPGTAPGRAVVTAAGNGGASNTHAGGCLSLTMTGCSGSVGFIVPSGSTRLSLDLWYTGGGAVGVTVTSACGGQQTTEAIPSQEGTVAQTVTTCGETITISGTTRAAENDDGHTAITLSG